MALPLVILVPCSSTASAAHQMLPSGLNNASRCPDEACRRVSFMEPALPIAPPFMQSFANPCIASSAAQTPPICLPYVHVVSGWHMFSEEALGWVKQLKQLESRSGREGCFDDWGDDAGAASWVAGWGGPPATDRVIMTHCNKLLTWYPAFAGRYTSAWGKAYGPCKEEYLKKPGDYYGTYMYGARAARERRATSEQAASGRRAASMHTPY